MYLCNVKRVLNGYVLRDKNTGEKKIVKCDRPAGLFVNMYLFWINEKPSGENKQNGNFSHP